MARLSLPAVTRPASATLSFGMAAIVAAGTLYVDIPYAATITSLKYNVGSAASTSFVVSVQIAGANVTGLASLAVSSSTDTVANATGANVISTGGGRVSFVFSGVTGNPTDSVLTLTWMPT